MTRLDFRPWASVALFVAVLAYVGCSSTSRTDTSSAPSPSPRRGTAGTSASSGSKAESSKGGGKVLANLGEPAGVLIITGERHGYNEPCGCTEGQAGGLLRLYDFVERLHQQNDWPTALIDLGSLTKDPAGARGGFDQAKIKFDYSVRALKLQDYRAVALSAEDLKVGVGEALGLFLNDLGETTKVVVANVAPPAGYESIFRPSLVAAAGPVKLGVTAVIDPEALDKLADPDKESIFPKAGIRRPEEVLPRVLADIEPKSDYQVLMVQGPPELAKRLAGSYPGFDIVVATSAYDDPLSHEPEALNGGKTLLVTVGRRGKYVGAIGFYPGGSQPPRFQLVTLNSPFDGPAAPMKALIRDEYRETLRQVGVVENFPRRDYINGTPGATFVGAENCELCHPKTYEKWTSTPHAQAFDSLLNDVKPNTIHDAECVSCHTTGFEYNSGWQSEAKTPYLAGNQCENCHGPGSKHIAEPDNAEFRRVMALTAEQADKNGQCTNCHDLDNSPHFKFDGYHRKISHKGLDTYTDPKVRRGIAPKVARSSPAASGSEDPQRKH
jgi:hypothetical protein